MAPETRKRTPKLRETVIARDGYRCLWCGEVFSSGNLDSHHLVPRTIGGPNEVWNLATVCREHHLQLSSASHYIGWPEWWDAAGPDLELGRCFTWGLRERSRNNAVLPPYVEEAITTAGYIHFAGGRISLSGYWNGLCTWDELSEAHPFLREEHGV